ncbi:stage II sporulation protein M [Haloferula sargassicola]|uniref:Stage II sporulation protein M n=1 Tax=Haloferula sargassicola TaxID=490096 RepID=A0ABP9UP40_9BACT
MKEADFEARREQAWQEFDQLVGSLERNQKPPGVQELPRRFREVCADLALASHRMYRSATLERLNALVIRGYKLLYRQRRGGAEKVTRFVVREFPAAVRADWRLFVLCSLFFWLPFFSMLLIAGNDLDWVRAILGPQQTAAMDSMYGSQADSLSNMRKEFGSNFMMFGFYIWNNIGIDFRVFAGGVVAGLGTLFYLISNGLNIGAAAGYATYACDPKAFWPFVAGHSAPELVGMVIAGMAGMKLGIGVLRPGRMTRGKSLAAAAKQALPLIIGAAGMTFLAAIIEGFWSAQDFPIATKYVFGGVMWLLHLAYFTLLGRRAA